MASSSSQYWVWDLPENSDPAARVAQPPVSKASGMAPPSAYPAARAAQPPTTTPWRSGYSDPPVTSNAQWKNKKHYKQDKLRLPGGLYPLSWQEWSNRLSGVFLGGKVEPELLYNADWSQDGQNGRPLGLLCQISKFLSYQLRWNLPTYESYNKRTGTVSLRELFSKKDLK